jgi:cytosine/adenosine deaminase-related metal-dependent hydrolase
MRLMLKLHRNPGMSNEDVPTAMQVLKMATVNGAMTTPFKTSIGTLQPGKAADLVLIDQRRITRPYLDPAVSIVDAIIHRARPSAVHAVMVSGEVIMRDGHFTNVDKEEVLRELADQLGRPKTEGEMWRDKLSKQLTPHVRDFYSGYCSCESTPRVFYPSVEAQ